MTARSIDTDSSMPLHLADKWRVFMLRFNNGDMLLLHVGTRVSFRSFCEDYIFQNLELIDQKQAALYHTSNIVAIEKIPNNNKPDFEITKTGYLLPVIG